LSSPILRPEATADIEEACRWYEARRQGLGDGFLDVVGEALEFIGTHRESAPIVHHDIRRQLLMRFPYGIFYRVIDGEVVVLGCFHASRTPRAWRSRS
jgi:plasmid stabilization system protein ParE